MRTTIALAATVITFLALLFVAAPASASIQVVNCVGVSSTTYEPGLTNTAADVYQSGQEEATCIDHLNLLHPILGFSASYEGDINASCNGIGTGSGTETFHWQDILGNYTGETSLWEWSFVSAVSVNGAYTAIAEGPITSGKYNGTMVRQVSTLPNTQLLACGTPAGMTSAEGALNWTFTSI